MTSKDDYYKANREAIIARQKAYLDANPEAKARRAERRRERYQENREKELAQCNAYRLAMKGRQVSDEVKKRRKERGAAWVEKNKEDVKAYQAAYRAKNKDKAAAYQIEYNKQHKERRAEYAKQYHAKTKETAASRVKRRYEANKTEILAYQREYRKKNADALRLKDKERYAKRKEQGLLDVDAAKKRAASWYEKNKSRLKTVRKQWVENNRARLRVLYAKRRNGKLQQTPAWADLDKMLAIYMQAEMLNQLGFAVHVDHIVPLNGKTVSGLHVENNLRIIDGIKNRKKGNAFDPDTFDAAAEFPLFVVEDLT